MENQQPIIENNEFNMQFEIVLEDEIAYLTYRFYKRNIAFMHTFVPEKLKGRGLASLLAAHAFDYAKEKQKLVMVYCPFVAKFVKSHPEYLSQIDKSYSARSSS